MPKESYRRLALRWPYTWGPSGRHRTHGHAGEVRQERRENGNLHRIPMSAKLTWRLRNIERAREGERIYRQKNRERLLENNRRWRKRNPERRRELDRKYKMKDPEKIRARQAVYRAVRDGKLKKPNNCSICGMPQPSFSIHGHHVNGYSRTLDVEWMCVRCHSKQHHQIELIIPE